jgi:Flp pilus assembly protein TadD
MERHGEAERELREALDLPGAGTYTVATLGYALARAGKHETARTLLATLEERHQREYVSPVALATLHIGLGELDRAIDWAERAKDEHRGWPLYFRVNPVVDPLRGHPRFEALVRQLQPGH